jgi:hypothetical protein
MPSIVPSQVVRFIDAKLSECIRDSPEAGRIELHPSVCGALNALLKLIEQLSNSLLPNDPTVYADFTLSAEYIRFSVMKAQGHDPARGGPVRFEGTRVRVIRDALAACPDEVPPRHSRELLFVQPADFREALLIDLETTRSALRNGEWKAATVLSGPLVEALLLWAIQQKVPTEIQAACSAALAARVLA